MNTKMDIKKLIRQSIITAISSIIAILVLAVLLNKDTLEKQSLLAEKDRIIEELKKDTEARLAEKDKEIADLKNYIDRQNQEIIKCQNSVLSYQNALIERDNYIKRLEAVCK